MVANSSAALCARLGLAICLFCTLPLLGCGSSTNSGKAGADQIKIGMVTDVGGLNDRSFNASSYQGLKLAERDLGAQIRAIPSTSTADYIPSLASLARQKYDLIVAVGFLMATATAKVAKKFPNANFVIIDVSQSGLAGKPKNVRGIVFQEKEAGYLAGYLAGRFVTQTGKRPIVSSVGGQEIPPVQHYIAGYEAGAKAANSSIKVLRTYSQDFTDQAKCKEAALHQIDQGSQVIFPVAGQCGLGALDAAKGSKLQAIGVDTDQSYLGNHILTSAIKRIDIAIRDIARLVQQKRFVGGTDSELSIENDGVGIGKVSAVGRPFESQITALKAKITSGKINIPDMPPNNDR